MQEALTNIVKHAQASTVSIVLARTTGAVTAVIEDDGRGFTPRRRHEGSGLLGMGERLGAAGRQADDRIEPRLRDDDRRRGAAAMSETTIRVLIVDDHAVVRSGLRKVLESEPDIEVVGEAGDAQHAVFRDARD